jgi:hypothetical protein
VQRIGRGIQENSKFKTKFGQWREGHGKQFKFGEKLTPREKEELLHLLYAYQELFIDNSKAPPAINGIEYALYFRKEDPIPVRMPIPRLAPDQMAHMEKDTLQMLTNHMIQFSDSEWATRPVFAKKKDGTWRYAIDYRKLNDQIVSDCQAIPNIPETLEALSKARRFSAFDACSGFWGIRMRDKDRKYTAFHAIYQGSWHLFEWLRMPFGLKSATATFQRMFMRVMGPGSCICAAKLGAEHSAECRDGAVSLINQICRIFVDDGIVYSECEEMHITDLARVLKRLVANGISLKASKCVWRSQCRG